MQTACVHDDDDDVFSTWWAYLRAHSTHDLSDWHYTYMMIEKVYKNDSNKVSLSQGSQVAWPRNMHARINCFVNPLSLPLSNHHHSVHPHHIDLSDTDHSDMYKDSPASSSFFFSRRYKRESSLIWLARASMLFDKGVPCRILACTTTRCSRLGRHLLFNFKEEVWL